MRLPSPLAIRTFEGVQAWARTLVDAIGLSWGVEHDGDGRHRFTWNDVPYDAGLFGSNAGTWTVAANDVLVNRYRLIGSTMTVNLDLQNTSTSGSAASYFTYAIPGNRIATARMGGPCVIADGGTQDCGWWVVSEGTRFIAFYRHPQIASNWSATSSNNTSLVAHMEFEVQ